MIKAKLLNSDAQLNNFAELGSVEYVPGENLTIVIRLFMSQRPHRYIPPNAAAEVKLSFQTNNDLTPVLSIVASEVDPLDRSMWKVELTQAQTQTLIGSNIEIEVDSAGDDVEIFKAVIGNALVRKNLSGDC